ncbi:MAG: nicotinate-nucleotide adenylyltransferase [Solibacillus sp.]
MKKVGIFGGTFNPPHIGHLIMANEVYAALELDEIRFMPNAQAPHKEVSSTASNAQRLAMVELAIQGVPYFNVERFEMERGGVSYTYETMKAMREREPDAEFYFIIGGDMIDSLHSWYHIDDLMELVHFVGVRRPGSRAKTDYKIMMVEAPEINLSSTFIRNRLQQKGPLHFLLQPDVEAFIRKEGLYGATTIVNGH